MSPGTRTTAVDSKTWRDKLACLLVFGGEFDRLFVYCELRRHIGPFSQPRCSRNIPFSQKKTMSYDDQCVSRFCNAGWGEVLTHMSPYGYANFGIAFGLGLSVVGAAWGIWLTGSSLVGAAVKAPRIRSKNLIRYEFTCILRALIADLALVSIKSESYDVIVVDA